MDNATCERCGGSFERPIPRGRPRTHRFPFCDACWRKVSDAGRLRPERRCPMWVARPGRRSAPRDPSLCRVPHPAPSVDCVKRWCIACGARLEPGGRNYHLKRACSKSCQQVLHRFGWSLSSSKRECVSCDEGFKPTGHSDIRCLPCRVENRHRRDVSERKCRQCGDVFTNAMGGREYCRVCSPPGSKAPTESRKEHWRRKNRKRRLARRNAGPAGKYTLAEVAERDGCKCHLCGKSVNMSLSGMHPKGPTIDHLVPLSADGPDEINNVALAHRDCNVRRGAGGYAQLRLVG